MTDSLFFRYRPILILALLSMGVTTLLILLVIVPLFQANKAQSYHLQSAIVQESLVKYLLTNKWLMQATQAYLVASDSISEDEFEIFAEKIIEGMDQVRVLGVVRRILDEERADFEAKMRQRGIATPYISRGLDRSKAETASEYYPTVLTYDRRPGDPQQSVGWDLKFAFESSRIDIDNPEMQATMPYLNTDGNIIYILVLPAPPILASDRKHFIILTVSPLNSLSKVPLAPGFVMTLFPAERKTDQSIDFDKVWTYAGPDIVDEYLLPGAGQWMEELPLQLGNQAFTVRLTRPYTAKAVELGMIAVLLLANTIIHGLVMVLLKSRFLRSRADAANEAKSQFLAVMSHEIRTPLNGVMGMADILRQTELNRSQQQYLDVIINSGKSLMAVINDVLDSSKIEAGKLRLENIDYNFHELIAELSTVYSNAEQDGNRRLVMAIAPRTPLYLHGDPLRLRQVLLNLLSNAFKFTERGVISVRVSSRTDVEGMCHLAIDVTDQGIGIGETQLKALFQSFYQAESDTHRKYGGSGLGLSICKQLLTLMGGTISVTSSLGEGSCFTVNLSLPRVDQVTARRGNFQGMRLLLVDNFVPFRDCFIEQAKALRISVSAADDLGYAAGLLNDPDCVDFDFIVVSSPATEDVTVSFVNQVRGSIVHQHARLLLFTDRLEAQVHTIDDYAGFDFVGRKPVSDIQLGDILQQAQSDGPSVSGAEQPIHAAARSLRLLVAEDNLVNVKVLTALLKNFGHEFHVVENGFAAIDYFREHYDEIDAVLMDCEMPQMDGFSAARRMREFEEGEGLPKMEIVALTAHALPEFKERCFRAGMTQFLAKPISANSLSTILNQLSRKILG